MRLVGSALRDELAVAWERWRRWPPPATAVEALAGRSPARAAVPAIR
ncbi:hypothetical protein [Mycolicibacterium neworleansense]|nr:hypothetical protein [Mycolicibacterium neworleansense]MCV7363915.1 hypothetical protein [Mycolicibacterium neworleansense]